MKYQILSYSKPSELQAAVTVALSQGWTPQGGVSVAMVFHGLEKRIGGWTDTATYYTCAQAMVMVD